MPVIDGADAVVFAAGAGPGSGAARKRTVDYGAAVKLIEAAETAGVRRYLMISAIGANHPDRWSEEMRPYYQAKAEADGQLEASALDYTIVRPGGLDRRPRERPRGCRSRPRPLRAGPARRRGRDAGRLPGRARDRAQGVRRARGRDADRRGSPPAVSEPEVGRRRARRLADTRRRAAVRRRRSLAALAAAALIVGAVVGAGTSDGDGSNLPHLSNAELAGIRVVTGFHGKRPPKTVRRLIAAGRISGVILFADNFDSAKGARRVARRLQAIKRPPGLRSPLLVMIDQEGGLVKRLPGPPSGSAEAMGHHAAAYVRRQGSKTGRLLRRAGVNVDLAPVLDVARPGSAIGAEHRSFGASARRVSSRANAFAAGLGARGIAATAKHFPGLGAAQANTDVAVQRIRIPNRKLRAIDERPYHRFIAGDGPVVMLSTAIYPHLSPLPAALAGRIATGELRHRLGFQGVSITDALDTTAARAVGGPARLADLGATAGTDLLLFSSPSDALTATRELTHGLRKRRFDLAGFHRSERRVLALRASLR